MTYLSSLWLPASRVQLLYTKQHGMQQQKILERDSEHHLAAETNPAPCLYCNSTIDIHPAPLRYVPLFSLAELSWPCGAVALPPGACKQCDNSSHTGQARTAGTALVMTCILRHTSALQPRSNAQGTCLIRQLIPHEKHQLRAVSFANCRHSRSAQGMS